MKGSPPIAYKNQGENLHLIIALVETTKLVLHEETIPQMLNNLSKRINKDGVLRDPVIVDLNTFVVLDGMHRVTSLLNLNCRFTGVCLVDYQNPNITVDRWCRAIKGSDLKDIVKEMETSEFQIHPSKEKFSIHKENKIQIVTKNLTYNILSHRLGMLSAFHLLSEIERWARNRRYEVTYVTEKEGRSKLAKEEIEAMICPPKLEKHQVLNVARSGRVFTFKTTRHIIPARPLGVNIPLSILKNNNITVKEANKQLSMILSSRQLSHLPPGSKWRGRHYDEDIYVFKDKK